MKSMAYLPRGISVELLISQVRNTMPYLFDSEGAETPFEDFIPARVVRDHSNQLGSPLSHFEYFRLCVSCHYLTCATPVPTDVDNQIRLKLWPLELPIEIAIQMAQWVLASRSWEFNQVSKRFTFGALGSPWQEESLSGHLGEWFTVSAGAYCALLQYSDPLSQQVRLDIFDAIRDEVRRHSEIFGSLWRAGEGLACLKTAANLSHNLGDLDRVMDMWNLPVGDPLRLEYYKLSVLPFDSNQKLRYLGRLWVAGELYKAPIMGSSMAQENHRYFALRKPKLLRQSLEFLIPNGPFFDDWGKQVGCRLSEWGEVGLALTHGWQRLPKTLGYGRSLRGLLQSHTDLSVDRLRQIPKFRMILDMNQETFEKKWNDEAVKQMDDIPSRA